MRYDVIVVGSGPAGSAAAYRAAKSGLNTLLVDQAVFPRRKTCAGGLTMAATTYLPEPLPSELRQCSISKLSTWLGDQREFYDKLECFMTTINRAEFDTWLLNLAVAEGAIPYLGCRVLGYQLENDGVVVVTKTGELRSRMLIGADGANSVIARQLRRGYRPTIGYCLQVEIPGAVTMDTIEIHYGLIPEGYGWVFPKLGSRVIGVGGTLARFRQPRRYLERVLWHHGCEAAAPLEAHSIPIGGRWSPVSCDGVLLVGDAAGFVDPFTGEGIRYALWSGRLAAETAVRVLAQHRRATAHHLTEYDNLCRKTIMPQLQHAHWMARSFFRFAHIIHPKLFGQPEPVDKLLDVLQGRCDYVQFARWAIRNLPHLVIDQQ